MEGVLLGNMPQQLAWVAELLMVLLTPSEHQLAAIVLGARRGGVELVQYKCCVGEGGAEEMLTCRYNKDVRLDRTLFRVDLVKDGEMN